MKRLAAALGLGVLAMSLAPSAFAQASGGEPGGSTGAGGAASPGGALQADGTAPLGGAPAASAPLVEPEPDAPTMGDHRHTLVQDDIEPTVRVLKTQDVEIKVGGLVQFFFAPYAGSDSLIANGDAVTKPGFRLRRAGFGIEGLIGPRLAVLIAVNAIQFSTEGAISDAKITYEVADWLRLAAGTTKVPFSRNQLESSRTLATIERPLAVNAISPSGRLGVSAEGEVANRHIAYLAGGYNSTEGFAQGNQFGGFLTGARLEVRPWARPDPWERIDGLAIAIDAVYENGPATTSVAYSGDVFGALHGAHLKAEGLCDRKVPKDAPVISPTIPDTVRRCGAYVEAGYVIPFPKVPVQPAARVEVFDDNTALHDAGDTIIVDAGLNAQLIKQYVRAQMHYIARIERYGQKRDNDALVLTLQGAF